MSFMPEHLPSYHTPRSSTVFEVLVLAIGAIASSLMLLYLGPAVLQAPTSAVLPAALAPFLVLMLMFHFIDRWEPEDRKIVIGGLLWGGGIAVLGAMLFNGLIETFFFVSSNDSFYAGNMTATFGAPIVEETLKGAFVISVILFKRQEISSLLDGLLYGAIPATAFAFVENILYFVRPFLGENPSADPLQDFWVTVFLRGAMSPFLHPLATSLIGFAAAFAMLYVRHAFVRLVTIAGGWIAAMLVHGLWNGSASISPVAWFTLYVLLFLPAWIGWTVWLLVLSQRDRTMIAAGLVPFCQTGTITPSEVAIVTDKQYRRYAMRWAAFYGKPYQRKMKLFAQNLAVVGLNHHVLHRLGEDPARAQRSQAAMLEATIIRQELQMLGQQPR